MRIFNFSAGPAVLPTAVLEQVRDELLDWHGRGMSIMEMSHRGKDFSGVIEEAEADLRELMGIPANYKVLFLQGGATQQFAQIPMNLLAGRSADYVLTGSWSKKAFKETQRVCGETAARCIASTEDKAAVADGFTRLPASAELQVNADAAYLHLCTNETIHGVELLDEAAFLAGVPTGVPVVADMSSHILSRPMDVSRYGLIYAGAQKNIGPSGLTLVIVREDLLGHALPACPSAFDYKIVADNQSMYNTPPTWGIYMAGLTFQWLKRQTEGGLTGVAAMEQRNIAKATLLYNAIDQSQLYVNKVAANCRSRMNIPFFLRDESRNDAFLAGAKERGLLQLKGHKSVGGMRASIYNAIPLAGVQALVDYMQEFERQQA